MNRIEAFLARCAALGYNLSGSVFKVDYNGRTYNIGFWIRPCNYNSRTQNYELPGICFKVKNADFDAGVTELLQEAEAKIQGR